MRVCVCVCAYVCVRMCVCVCVCVCASVLLTFWLSLTSFTREGFSVLNLARSETVIGPWGASAILERNFFIIFNCDLYYKACAYSQIMLQHIMARGMFPSLAVAAQAVQRSVTGSRGLLKPARPVFDPLAPNLPEPFAHLPRPTKAESTIKTATFVKSSVAMHHMPPEVRTSARTHKHSARKRVCKEELFSLLVIPPE